MDNSTEISTQSSQEKPKRVDLRMKEYIEHSSQENLPVFAAIQDFHHSLELRRELQLLVQKPEKSDLAEWEKPNRIAQLNAEIGAHNANIFQQDKEPAYRTGRVQISKYWEHALAEIVDLQKDNHGDPWEDAFVQFDHQVVVAESNQSAKWHRDQNKTS